MTHSLILGDLLLTGSRDFADPDHGFWFEVCAEGTEFGSPQAVTRIITSLLVDGAIVSYDSDGNREIPVRVRVNGPTLAAVAHGEAALRMASKRRNELTWQPPDTFAPPSVYETYPSAMSRQGDWDLDELRHVRTFNLSLTCSPFARSQEPVVVEALAAPGAPVSAVIDNADSPTGWTAAAANSAGGSTTPAVTDQGDWIRTASTMPPPAGLGRWALSLERVVAPVDMSTTPYVRIETSGTSGASESFWLQVGGAWIRVSPNLSRTLSSTVTQHYFDVSLLGTSLTGVRVGRFAQGPTTLEVGVHDVSRTNSLASSTSSRQLSRIVEVGGTERTPASLRVSTVSGYLGVTMAHTTPHDGSGYTPDMRRWRSSGNTTSVNSDARKISGTWELMRPNPVISRTPAHSLPRGNYLLVAAIKSDTVAVGTSRLPIDWAVKSVVAGEVIGNAEGTGYGLFPVAHELTIVPIASLAAPVVRSGALDVEVHLFNPTDTVTLSIEQWWMFTDDDDSALSIVNTSEGALWLDSPNADSPVPTVWVGPSKPLAFHPANGLVSQGTHTFRPGPTLVTTVSDSNDYASASLEYYKRWHSNAAE